MKINNLKFSRIYLGEKLSRLDGQERVMGASDSSIRRLFPIYIFTVLWAISWSASVSGPIMPLYIRSLGKGVMEWGMLVTSHAVGMVLLEWLWGTLSDRVDRRIFMVLSMIGMSVIFPLYTVKALLPYFSILQFSLGALAVTMAPISRALISDYSSARSIAMSMSLWLVAMTLGGAVGSLTGSYVAQVWSFEQTFYLSSILSLIGCLAVSITLRREGGHRPQMERGDSSIVKGLKTLVSRPSTRGLFSIAVISFMARSGTWSFLPLYASEKVGMSTVEVGMVAAVMSLTQLAAAPLFGKLSYRVGRKRLVTVAFALASVMLLCYFYVETSLQLFLVSIGVSICLSASPLLLAMLSEATPGRLRGMSMGVYGTFEGIGLMIGPPIYSLIWSIHAPGFVFVASAAVQSLSFLLIHMIKVEPGKNREGPMARGS